MVSGMGHHGPLGPMLCRRCMRGAARRSGVMSAECAQLGGHGVVGMSLTIGRFFGRMAWEFKAIGTAVRAPGGVSLAQPFTSHLSGQDFAKLIMAGRSGFYLVLGTGRRPAR